MYWLVGRRVRDRKKRVVKRKKAKQKADKNSRTKQREMLRILKVKEKDRAVSNLFSAIQKQLATATAKQIV